MSSVKHLCWLAGFIALMVLLMAGCAKERRDADVPVSANEPEGQCLSCPAFNALELPNKVYAFQLYQALAGQNNGQGVDLSNSAEVARFSDQLDIALQFASGDSRPSIVDLVNALHDSSASGWTDYQECRTNSMVSVELFCWVMEDSGHRWLNGAIGVADGTGQRQLLFATVEPSSIPKSSHLVFTNIPEAVAGRAEKTVWQYPALVAVRNGMGGIEDVRIVAG